MSDTPALELVCNPYFIADQVAAGHMSQFRGDETYRHAATELAQLKSQITNLLQEKGYYLNELDNARRRGAQTSSEVVDQLRAALAEEKQMRGMAENSGLALFEKNKNLIAELNKAHGLIGAVLAWLVTFKDKYNDASANEKYLELTAYTESHPEPK
jgi:hypothetical protein